MKPWEEYDQKLAQAHLEAKPDEVNDYWAHQLLENVDELYEMDGEFFNDKTHYE